MAFVAGNAQKKTATVSISQGDHARRISPARGRTGSAAATPSPGKLQTVRGRQKRSSSSKAPIEASALAVSTSHGPWRLLIRNCTTEKLRPATRHAGQTSLIARQPASAATSQNG